MNTKTQKIRSHYCKLDQSYENYSSESANDEGKLDHDATRDFAIALFELLFNVLPPLKNSLFQKSATNFLWSWALLPILSRLGKNHFSKIAQSVLEHRAH
jgi:hypothetical protein